MVRIYVTGASGLVGTDLCPELENAGHELHGRERVEVTDPAAIEQAIGAARPDWVVHLAAYTDVDGAEAHPEEARRVNVGGTRAVAAAARQARARLLVVSTDYVYDGRRTEPYVETDPVAPLSSYGRTKLDAERAAGEICPDVLIARTAWVYGPGGRNFVDTMLRLAAERPRIDVVEDEIGCPTYSADLSRALRALLGADAAGIVHVAGSGHTSWFDFAREILRRAGDDPDKIQPTTSARLARAAPRPARSVLSGARLVELVGFALPDWREALAAYLARRRLEVHR